MARNLDFPLNDIADLSNEILWTSYPHAGNFNLACSVYPDAPNEQLVIRTEHRNLDKPCAYAMVIDGRLFRFGASLNGVKGRISSYNTGKKAYKGRNSRTNLWVLQSLLNIELPVDFYAYLLPMVTVEYFPNYTEKRPEPSPKDFKTWLISNFEEIYGDKPIGNKRV